MNKLYTQVKDCLIQLKPVSLDEMNSVALMKRLDSKFILSLDRLPELIDRINENYSVLTIEEETIFKYRTTYYDTEDLETYRDHLRGKSLRHKVRIREYINTAISFFEIKKKDNSGVTNKVRIKTIKIEKDLVFLQLNFFDTHLENAQGENYKKVLSNTFNRITLANPLDQERVTIDFNLGFDNDIKKKAFKNLCIVEIKQPRINRFTPIFIELKKMGIRPLRISKYCLGVTTLNDVRSNLFKPKMRQILKTIN